MVELDSHQLAELETRRLSKPYLVTLQLLIGQVSRTSRDENEEPQVSSRRTNSIVNAEFVEDDYQRTCSL